MRNFWRNYLKTNLFFWLFSLTGMGLMIIGFFTPPQAEIHQSVLIAVGEIHIFISLGVVLKAVDKGIDATFQKGDTSLTITNEDKKEREDGV